MGPTASDRKFCSDVIAKLRNEGVFTPPSVQGTLAIPGHIGGMNWSGYAFDPGRGLLVVNTNNLAVSVRLIPRDKIRSEKIEGSYGAQHGTPYAMVRRFLQSPSDLPCTAPPWGMLTTINLATGKIRWQVPLGSMQGFGGSHGPIPAGTISLDGPIVTSGGLIFIAGTTDAHIRAFDTNTGKELWRAKLPAGGHATPMTYQFQGKQYVVIAAGGSPGISEESPGDTLVAFALP